jgi:hypothetical protein
VSEYKLWVHAVDACFDYVYRQIQLMLLDVAGAVFRRHAFNLIRTYGYAHIHCCQPSTDGDSRSDSSTRPLPAVSLNCLKVSLDMPPESVTAIAA